MCAYMRVDTSAAAQISMQSDSSSAASLETHVRGVGRPPRIVPIRRWHGLCLGTTSAALDTCFTDLDGADAAFVPSPVREPPPFLHCPVAIRDLGRAAQAGLRRPPTSDDAGADDAGGAGAALTRRRLHRHHSGGMTAEYLWRPLSDRWFAARVIPARQVQQNRTSTRADFDRCEPPHAVRRAGAMATQLLHRNAL